MNIMKLKVITESEKFKEDNDYRRFFVIKVDGKEKVNFLDGEPEDANISRDFNDIFSIPNLMLSAYEAGKKR